MSHQPVVGLVAKEHTQEIDRRQIPLYKGVYTDGSIQGAEVTLTIDTGCSDTVAS